MRDYRPSVLFLCTGNSCRSQMAEGFLRKYAGDRFEVHSAGLKPAAQMNPLAVQVMQEVGVDISGQHPKGVKDYLGQISVHALIIVCAGAEKNCPSIWPGALQRFHWPFEDPAAFVGDEESTLAKFREVRDLISRRVKAWVHEQP